MRKIFLSAIMVMACITSVNAQNPQREGRKSISPEKLVARMDKELDLTDQQEKDLTALYTDFYKNLKELKQSENSKDSKKERRAQREEFQKKFNEILSPEQQQKWAELKKARAEKRRAKAGK